MSQIHAMSDEQVAGELKKMTAFIKQEALEKAREIQLKADEEFAIEKSKLVRQETSSIDAEYEKKFKQASMSQQITQSTVANKSRLQILGARQEVLDTLFEEAQKKLGDFSQSGGKGKGPGYQEICKNLILEGLYGLNESKITIRVRKADNDIAKKAIADAQKEYKENMRKDVKVEIDEKNPLPEDSKGGVHLYGSGGRIDINNTFEQRLKILETDSLPVIRMMLFGANENRKFDQ